MRFQGQRAVVTGGAGFVGSHVVDALLDEGASVSVIDNFDTGKRANLPKCPEASGLKVIPGDISDGKFVSNAIGDVDFIFHLAATSLMPSLADPVRDLMVNSLGTLNLLLAAKSSPMIKMFVHSSTGSVYGQPMIDPQTEDHPLNPTTPYGVSKLAAEKYGLMMSSLNGLPYVSLRYYNVYGPRQSMMGVIPTFIDRALNRLPLLVDGDGTQERCFTYVQDVARATVDAALRSEAKGGTFNIAAGPSVRIIDLARLVNELTANRAPIEFRSPRPGEISAFRPDITRAKKTLRFSPTISLREGLRTTIDWYRTSQVRPLIPSGNEEPRS